MRHLIYIHLAEGTLLVLSALGAFAEVALFVFVVEFSTASVGADKFAHVKHIFDLARDLDLLKLLLAQWTDRVPRQPLIQTWTADEALAITARCEIFQYICANGTNELLQNFLELGFSIIYGQFFQFVS